MNINHVQTLLSRIEQLEFHQSLLMKIIENSHADFYKLVIKKSLTEHDVMEFMTLCEELSNLMEEQKAEGFIHFHPIFAEFKAKLHPNLHAEEVIKACLRQHLFKPLMAELRKYL